MFIPIIELFLAGVTVTMPVEAKVKGTEIEVGEVCQVAGLDGELVARVRAIELGYAPAPGFSRLMTAQRVSAELARALPGVEIRVTGERACRVWPEIDEIRPEILQEAARIELLKAFAGKEATFTLAEPIGIARVPLGERATTLRVRVPNKDLRSGVVRVAVEVMVDGLRYRTVWTSWRVSVWETRQVLARRVLAGEELRPELFIRSRVPVGTDGGLTTLSPVQVLGAVAKRDMGPGERVTTHDVYRPAAVTLGSTLFLRVRKGSIQARVSALALETGSVGDRIRVRTIESGQELQATVIARDACEIYL